MNKTYKDIIEEKGFFITAPIGNSMWPMLRNRLDTVKLVKPKDLKKYDVILYIRENGQYILHRIIKVRIADYVLCGDNQWQKECHITNDMIIGVLDGFYRKEKYISKNNLFYKLYSRVWVNLRIVRMIFGRTKNLIKKLGS